MSDLPTRLNIPVPDPSALTTEQLRRELQSLREFLMKDMQRIEEVHVEKFKGIDVRFAESKTALDAALRAQKDTADKSEASFTKQIDGLQDSIRSSAAATGDRIDDLKGRLDRGEGSQSGVSSTITTIVAVIAVLIALAGLATAIAMNVNRPPAVLAVPKT